MYEQIRICIRGAWGDGLIIKRNMRAFASSALVVTWMTVGSRLVVQIIIITLFKSQIILAEHESSTNWGDCKSNQINQINQINQVKCWFLRRGENWSTRRKTSRGRVENQQTQPTGDAGSGNRTRDTLISIHT